MGIHVTPVNHKPRCLEAIVLINLRRLDDHRKLLVICHFNRGDAGTKSSCRGCDRHLLASVKAMVIHRVEGDHHGIHTGRNGHLAGQENFTGIIVS